MHHLMGRRTTRVVAAALTAATVLVACGAETGSDATTTATTEQDTADQTDTDTTTADDTTTEDTTADETATEAAEPAQQGGPAGNGGGPGGGVDAADVSTEAELVTLIAEDALGDGSLDLHRGHMPVQSTLEETLGITHDEMHVRMEEQGQNLAAVADDLGIGAEALVDALTASFEPAIDNLLAAGELTEEEAEQYREDLRAAFVFRVYWDGQEAKPSYTGAGTLTSA